MGLGKSSITLTAVDDLIYNRLEVSKCLVIAPKKVAEATWQNEGKKWEHLHRLRFSTVLGTGMQRLQALETPADVYVINRENVEWLVERFRNCWPFDMVVIDESSSFKSRASKRFKALCRVRHGIKRLVELTGTPAPNGLMDLWAQIYLLDGGERLGKTLTGFRDRYFEPDRRNRTVVFSYREKPGADEAIRAAISDICVSMRSEDYLDLPPILYDDIPVVLEPFAKKMYDTMERDALLAVADTQIDAGTAAALTTKLLQMCNGAAYNEYNEVVEIHDAKLTALKETLEQLNGKRVLLFYNFKHDLTRIQETLKGLQLRVRRLQTPEDADAWNAQEVDVLLAHPASCAYGLNLQAGGNHVIWFGLNWSLELYQQANARLHRQGQSERVIVHHLIVQSGMDEDVMRALHGKEHTQDSLLKAIAAKIKKAKGE